MQVAGENIDHPSVTSIPWGTADIFFPTDFDMLASLYQWAGQHVWGEAGEGAHGSARARVAARCHACVRRGSVQCESQRGAAPGPVGVHRLPAFGLPGQLP